MLARRPHATAKTARRTTSLANISIIIINNNKIIIIIIIIKLDSSEKI
jgi:hypothetical protein